jgi:hypothetical protein
VARTLRMVLMPHYCHVAISVRRLRFASSVMTSCEPINIAALEG